MFEVSTDNRRLKNVSEKLIGVRPSGGRHLRKLFESYRAHPREGAFLHMPVQKKPGKHESRQATGNLRERVSSQNLTFLNNVPCA
jgi:hypothetical protein